ncbi:hypothetical protein HPB47_025921 [Ixodes persulcatus]|uniref:Uncharacterized protein n=1 Tax=Ixodes persulcatus TaxID=34615 RepID=A0AC60Q262_IXOPE|nr:hypothetical protein HPB47_025921 [Ixodes persulcatus]
MGEGWGREDVFSLTMIGGRVDRFTKYPTLRDLFSRYNIVVPSSASVEHLFSVGGHVFKKNWGRLSNKKFENQLFPRYLDGVADSACGLRGPSFDRYSDLWTLSEFWQSNAAWRACFESWRTSAGTRESTLGRIPASHKAAARAVLERRSDSVLRHLLLGTVSGPLLTDFDWAVKLVLGSDRVSSLGVPLAALDLCLRDHTGPRRLCLELGSAELLALVGALEAAHKARDFQGRLCCAAGTLGRAAPEVNKIAVEISLTPRETKLVFDSLPYRSWMRSCRRAIVHASLGKGPAPCWWSRWAPVTIARDRGQGDRGTRRESRRPAAW